MLFWTTRKIALCFLLVAVMVPCGFAAESKVPEKKPETGVVVLKNGDRLTGTVVKLEGGKLTFKTAYAADPIVIRWDQVEKLAVAESMVLTIEHGSTRVKGLEADGKNVKLLEDSMSAELEGQKIKTLRSVADERIYQKTLHPDWAHGWNFNAHASFTLARGNANTQSTGADASAVRATTNDKTTVKFTTLYSRDNTSNTSTASTSDGSLRYDRNVHPRVFVYVSSEFLDNQLQFLDLRSLQSVGAGLHAVKRKQQTLDLYGGVSWTHESYSASTSASASRSDFAALNVGQSYNAKLGKPSTLVEQATFYPNMNNAGSYEFSLTSTLTTRLVKILSWNVNFTDNYTSFPPSGTKPNDVIFTTGIGLTWLRP